MNQLYIALKVTNIEVLYIFIFIYEQDKQNNLQFEFIGQFGNISSIYLLFGKFCIIIQQKGGLIISKMTMQPVSYIYNQQITKYIFSEDHPMKPKRIKMTHSLIQNFGLTQSMRIFHGRSASSQQICQFHHPDYIDYLQNWVSPNPTAIVKNFQIPTQTVRQAENEKYNQMYKINRTFDCPSFEGLYDFCSLAVGGSLDAADLIITGEAHHAINWSGGYHHAKKSEASGFCYVNDIVVCITELLKVYPRVLYLDIDVHHGDGVEEAFYHTNRVMTLSFHQFDQQFFPGTGEVESIGEGIGRYYCANVPLKKGMDDQSYLYIFKKITDIVMSSYRPDVIVFQSGADSLSKDRIGNFELTISAYGQCVKHMMGFNVPMIMLGGGGYTIQNVARCWAYETSVLLGHNIGNDIPQYNQFYNYYKDDNFKMHFQPKLNPNMNTRKDLDRIVQTISENMRQADIRPSISFHYAPKHFLPGNQMDWEHIREEDNSMVEEDNEKYITMK